MDWAALVSTLGGVLVGGLITVFGQLLADRRREKSAVNADLRRVKLAANERNRLHAIKLHERVSYDMAYVMKRVSESNEEVDPNRADSLSLLAEDLSEKHARAGVLIAMADDVAAREAVDAYYMTFGLYLVSEREQMLGQPVQNPVSLKDVWSSRDAATNAVREYLRELGRDEEKFFEG